MNEPLLVARTPDEIEAELANNEVAEFFGAYSSELIEALPWEKAKGHLKEEYRGNTAEWWNETRMTDDIRRRALGYMDFAISKILGERGLSAARNIEHARAWVWLALGDAAAAEFDDAEYGWCGRDQMRHAYTVLGLRAEWDAAIQGEPDA